MGTERFSVISHGKMPRKEIRKNRYKIKCLVCTPSVEMDFDHRSKHNSRFHQDMLKSRKHIRYEVVGAPRNPFEAAAKRTREAEETNACVTQNQVTDKSLQTVQRLEFQMIIKMTNVYPLSLRSSLFLKCIETKI